MPTNTNTNEHQTNVVNQRQRQPTPTTVNQTRGHSPLKPVGVLRSQDFLRNNSASRKKIPDDVVFMKDVPYNEQPAAKIRPPNISPSKYRTPTFLSSRHYTPQAAEKQKLNKARYTRLLNEYKYQVLSTDNLPDHTAQNFALFDSPVLNSLWTSDEKERFFTALARCGKDSLAEITRRVGSKSLAEVSAYVGVLEEATAMRKSSQRQRHRVYDFARVPAAVEVDEQWLAFEEKSAQSVAQDNIQDDDTQDSMQNQHTKDDSVLNVDKANELAQWYTS